MTFKHLTPSLELIFKNFQAQTLAKKLRFQKLSGDVSNLLLFIKARRSVPTR